MKKSSRNWSLEEDKKLTQTMLANNGARKLKWQQVAQVMHSEINHCQKTGKQCRERWHNHLAPQLNNSSQWTKLQNQTLFKQHTILGNKWAKIATYLKGRTDNCVKNHFYSTLRRGMRKVNNFILEKRKLKQKQKITYKQFKPDVLTKILIVADGDPEQKLNVKNNATDLSRNIKQILIQISLQQQEQEKADKLTSEKEGRQNLNVDNHKLSLSPNDDERINDVINLIMQFNKSCKKRKGKKKGSSDKTNHIQKSEDLQLEQDQLSQIKQQSKKVQYYDDEDSEQDDKQIKKNEKTEKTNKIISKNWKKNEIKQQQVEQANNNMKKQNNNNSVNSVNKNNTEQNKQVLKFNEQDQVKSMDLEHPPVQIEEKGSIWKKNHFRKPGSIQSINSCFQNNMMNFASSFVGAGGGSIGSEEPIFRNSGFNLFQPQEQIGPGSKEMFADSGIGFKKNQALMYLSAISGSDERNSFLRLDGDRGVVDTQFFMNNNGNHIFNNGNMINTNIDSQVNKNSFNPPGQTFKFKKQQNCNSPCVYSHSSINGFNTFAGLQKSFSLNNNYNGNNFANINVSQNIKDPQQSKGKK